MAVTRSTRTASPTPSDSSDMFWETFDDEHVTPSPTPKKTADALEWESDSTPAPMDATEATPTPQGVCVSSPASVVEISRDEFPALEAPAPAAATKSRAKSSKDKGKKKATTKAATRDEEDPFLVADIERAKAVSLGLATSQDHATEGASSSRRSAATSGFPSKRLRANTTGDAAPAPFAAVAIAAAPATVSLIAPAAPAAAPASTPTAPVAAIVTTPATATFATTPTAAPTPAVPTVAAPATVPTAMPAAAQVVAAPVTVPTVAPIVAAPAGAPVIAGPAAAPAAAPAPHAGAALPPLWMTVDGLPPRGSYTPTLAGGFPDIIYSPEQLLQGVPVDLVQMYDAIAHPKFFMVVSGGNGAVMRTHGLIRDAIGNFINVDPQTWAMAPQTRSPGGMGKGWEMTPRGRVSAASVTSSSPPPLTS
ncbi:hypothetical protein C8R44DRAFT_748246 [Mycena epipterygia]|nr:hypothetical protein C8R44DRAFT_748246 [Mycena epipterygia]